jgi:hypothetical protein
MLLEFQALEGGFEAGDTLDCLTCGVSGQDSTGATHYMHLARDLEEQNPSEDWGVYFEIDDQANAGYNCVRGCRLTRTTLEIALTHPVDWQKKYTGVRVDISGFDDATHAGMREGLPRIFRATTGVLEVA